MRPVANDDVTPILSEEFKRRGWDEHEVSHRRKGNPQNVQIARRLRAQTTLTLAWIARAPNMGRRLTR